MPRRPTPATRALIVGMCVAILFPLTASAQSAHIAYVIPDVGAPAMNTYIDLIAPYGFTGDFGTDGVYLNNPGDAVRIMCAADGDSGKLKFGPVVVSWNGRIASTQVFVYPGLQPNSTYWRDLRPEFRVPIKILVNGLNFNADTFYIVKPQTFGVKNAAGVIGSGGGWGVRSRRGAMIVDSMILTGTGRYTLDTSDVDPTTVRNEGYLPFIVLSKGRVSVASGARVDASAPDMNGAPGGGGGGHGQWTPCIVVPARERDGQGFTKGGGEWKPSTSTCDPNRAGINMCPGGECGFLDSAGGGGTGHPCASGGYGPSADDIQCQAQTTQAAGGSSGSRNPPRGGGGGGFATTGLKAGGCPNENGGSAVGNSELVPMAGGAGGAGGNGTGCNESGSGGGGGGAVVMYGWWTDVNEVDVIGADGEAPLFAAAGSIATGGGGGSGGGIMIGGKMTMGGALSMKTAGGAGGGTVGAGGAGGAGRVRVDGPIIGSVVVTPLGATSYRGPSCDTGHTASPNVALTGTGNGQPIRVYMRGESTPWALLTTLSGYTNNQWSTALLLPRTDSLYFVTVAQQVPTPSSGMYNAEPSWVMSQAGANIYHYVVPAISSIDTLRFPVTVCSSTGRDTLWVRNPGSQTLVISNISVQGTDAAAFTIVAPTVFPVNVNPGDSTTVIVTVTASTLGDRRASLSIVNNDPRVGHNPWTVGLTDRRERVGFRVQDSLVLPFIHAGVVVDTSIMFHATGTIGDTITNVSRASGPAWVQYFKPFLPALVLAPPMPDSLALRFLVNGPLDTGAFTSTFRVHCEPCGLDTPVVIKGYVRSGIMLAPTTHDFGTLLCQSEQCDTFAVKNTGNGTLTIAGFQFTGGDSAQFFAPASQLPIVVPVGASRTVNVCVHPVGKPGARTTTMLILSDDSLSLFRPASLVLTAHKESAGLSVPVSAFAGNICVGQQLCTTVHISSTGSSWDTLTSATLSGGAGTMQVSAGTFPRAIAPGGSDSLTVCFTPTDTGAFRSTVTVKTVQCGGGATFAVTGSGIHTELVAADSALQLGGVRLGSTVHSVARYSVVGNANLQINTVTISPVATGVAIDSIRPKVPRLLHPRDSLRVFLRFAPGADTAVSGRVAIAVTTQCGDAQSVAFSGRGVSSSLVLSRTAIPFGSFACAASTSVDSVVVTNAGVAPLNITCSISGPDASMFKIVSAASFSVTPGASTPILLRTTPVGVGVHTARLIIVSDDSKHPRDTVPLTAIVDSVSFTAQTALLDFGKIEACSTSRDSFLIVTNTGTTPDTITASIATQDFSVVSAMPRIVAPGASDTIVIRCAPRIPGAAVSGDVSLNSRPCARTATVQVRGSSDSSSLPLGALDCGAVATGQTLDTMLIYRNVLNVNVCVRSLAPASPSSRFIVAAQVPKVLVAGDTLQIHVRFSPASNGPVSATSGLVVDCPCSLTVPIALAGSGIPPGGCVVASTLALPTLRAPAGSTVTVPLTLTASQGIALCGAESYTARVIFNRTVLIPTSTIDVVRGSRFDTITVRGGHADTVGQIGQLTFTAALGDTDVTPLHVETFTWNEAQTLASSRDGSFTLSDFCSNGGPRTFITSGGLSLAQNRPNPVTDRCEIDYSIYETGRTQVYIVDMLGRRVATAVDAIQSRGQFTAALTVAGLTPGAYALVLKTPTQRLTRRLEIAR